MRPDEAQLVPVVHRRDPQRPRRDRRESGGAARGRSLWTHRGERSDDAITPPQPTNRGALADGS